MSPISIEGTLKLEALRSYPWICRLFIDSKQNSGQSGMGDWSDLPSDLLDEIGKRLTYVDYIRFCAVCAHWKSMIPKRPKLPICQIPWLMLPSQESIYSLVEDKVYPLDLPEARGKQYRGSSHGWLATVEEGPTLKLLNPLTRVQFHLPPLSTLPNVTEYLPHRLGQEYTVHQPHPQNNSRFFRYSEKEILNFFISKIVMSPNHLSTSNKYSAAAIYGEYCRLSFCKRDDKRWIASSPYEIMCNFHDAIFHQGKFYAVNSNGKLVGSDIASLPQLDTILVPPPGFRFGHLLYLVGTSAGGLLMVGRFHEMFPLQGDMYPYTTTKFNVYRLQTSWGRRFWAEVESLHNMIIFLGYNSSFLVPSRDFPELKGNCIYYTDNYSEGHRQGVQGGHDVGVFNLQDKSNERLPGFTGDNILNWPPPIWMLPRPR